MTNNWFRLVVAAWAACTAAQAQSYVTPMMGGGQTAADMVHIDIFYDELSNRLLATIDQSAATPVLRPLPPSTAFDPAQAYAVLNGKAYNSQYGWNAGGQFAIPSGAAIWIEMVNCSPGLETYAGWGRFASYEPLFAGSALPRLWQWSGVMAHNTYALNKAILPFQFASYHIYFGDVQTGAQAPYSNYGDTTVTLTWNAELPSPSVMLFGAEETNGAPLCFLNCSEFDTNSQVVLNLHQTNGGPFASDYSCPLAAVAVPATAMNGGPYTNHAAPGSTLALQFVSLSGPAQGQLKLYKDGDPQPGFTMLAGETAGTNRLNLTESRRPPDLDPYGVIQGRHFAVSRPGLYCLGFCVIDVSANGLGGGPIHAASPLYHVYLQAGLTINSLSGQGNSVAVSFAGEPGKNFYLERSTTLDSFGNWQTVAGPVAGTNCVQTLTDPAGPGDTAFFRISIR